MARVWEHAKIYAAELLSSVSAHVPPIGRLVLGADERVQRVAWRYVPPERVLELHGPWVRVQGDPDGPRLPWPAHYRRVARVGVTPEQRGAAGSRRPLMLAWKLGEAVMAATLTTEQSDAIRRQGHFHMRVGRAGAEFAIGQTHPDGVVVLRGATRQSPASVEVLPLQRVAADAPIY